MSKNDEEMTLQKLEAIENEIKDKKKKNQTQKKSAQNNNKKNSKKANPNPIVDTPIKANQIISDEELEALKNKKKKKNKKTKNKVETEAKIEELIESKKSEKSKTKKEIEEVEENEEIGLEKLDKISKELRLIKLQNEKKRHPRLIRIFINTILAISFVLYIYLIMMLPQTIGKDSFILSLKITSLVLAAISVILLEIGFSKKKVGCYFHSLEFLFMAGYTLSLTLLIIKESYLTKAFQIVSVCVLVLYFIIKSIIVMIKVKK